MKNRLNRSLWNISLSRDRKQFYLAEDFLLPENLLENILYLTELFTYTPPPVLTSSPKKRRLSTLSLDSIERDNDDRLHYFLYDSLNDDESSDEEQFHDCLNETLLLRTIADERQLIERLTRQYSSMDSLDNDDTIARSSKTSSMM
jgi:hypothetical protein